MILKKTILFITMQLVFCFCFAQKVKKIKSIFVDSAWASNSINTVIFRKNSLTTFHKTQFISFYNKNANVVIGKRKIGSKKWNLVITKYKGKVTDAHNSISIAVDGNGFLHIAWNHHNNTLHYCKSIAPLSLVLTNEMEMTGKAEQKVTYPEFYNLPNGNLIFLYRDGQSGKGNLVINNYDVVQKKWNQVQHNLIDGENSRNAYWQACVDKKGTLHLSWVWRETADVASNHDMCYAKSNDGGLTWYNSKNEMYQLPINATTAEYVCNIAQKSELINQTSMCSDDDGNPIIATYWKNNTDIAPQYKIIYLKNKIWQVFNTNFITNNFSLSGLGTKRIPIARPLVVASGNKVAIIFRDEAHQNFPYIAICNDLNNNKWTKQPITTNAVGAWEPTFDNQLWLNKNKINLFVQLTEQKDGEGQTRLAPQPVTIVSFKLK